MTYKKGENTGEKNSRWNGGIKIHAHGYRLIASPHHPFKDKQGYVREHRLVIEAIIGRWLKLEEEVHHLDGNRQNNTPENLVLCATKEEHLKKYHRNNGKETRFKKGNSTPNPKNGKEISCRACKIMFYVPKGLLKKRKTCGKKECKSISVSRQMKGNQYARL